MAKIEDHPEIWLDCKCTEHCSGEGRLWAQDNPFESCELPTCSGPQRYVRADLYEDLQQAQAAKIVDCQVWKDHAERLSAVLQDAQAQIVYLHEKFKETGSGNGVLAKITFVLNNKPK